MELMSGYTMPLQKNAHLMRTMQWMQLIQGFKFYCFKVAVDSTVPSVKLVVQSGNGAYNMVRSHWIDGSSCEWNGKLGCVLLPWFKLVAPSCFCSVLLGLLVYASGSYRLWVVLQSFIYAGVYCFMAFSAIRFVLLFDFWCICFR